LIRPRLPQKIRFPFLSCPSGWPAAVPLSAAFTRPPLSLRKAVLFATSKKANILDRRHGFGYSQWFVLQHGAPAQPAPRQPEKRPLIGAAPRIVQQSRQFRVAGNPRTGVAVYAEENII